MNRRAFLSTGAVALPQVAQPQTLASRPAASSEARIDKVEIWKLEGTRVATASHNQFQVQPLHIYDELRPKPYVEPKDAVPRPRPVSALYLEVHAGDLTGRYGPIDSEAAVVIDQQLRPFLAGKDALAIEKLWDQMYRSNRHSRHGYFLMAMSAVDNALWDLRGKLFGAPVYRVLGGPTRTRIPAYASCLGFPIDPDSARKKAADLAAQGYRAQKWFLASGPGDGGEGMKRNVDLVRAVREGAGEATDLMFDAYSGWNLDYAIAWAKQVEQYRPRWIEEAVHPEKMEEFVELRRKINFPVATGEHLYGRWEANNYLKAGAISVLQSDPEWCGGVSELSKICAIASLYDAQVIPHGHSIHASLHVVASQSPGVCPMIEYLINKMESYYHFERRQFVVERGTVALPEAPGFGIEFDDAKVEKRSLAKWS